MRKLSLGAQQRIKEALRQGLTISQVSYMEGLSYNTVHKYSQDVSEPIPCSSGAGRPRVLQSADASRVVDQFKWMNCKYMPTYFYVCSHPEEFGLPSGFSCSIRTFRRYVQGLVPEAPTRNRKPHKRKFHTSAGDQVQIDYGETYFDINGKPVNVNFLVVVYAYSRRTFVVVTADQKGPSWMFGIAKILGKYGIPRRIVCDNAKPLVATHQGDLVVFTEPFKLLCKQLGLSPYACKPYRPQTKGRAESNVKYIKDNAFAHAKGQFQSVCTSLDELQARLDDWATEVSDERLWCTAPGETKKIIDVYNDEEAPNLYFLSEEQLKNVQVYTAQLDVSSKGEVTFYGHTVTVNSDSSSYSQVQVAVFSSANYIILSMDNKVITTGELPVENLTNFPFIVKRDTKTSTQRKDTSTKRKKKSAPPKAAPDIGSRYTDACAILQSGSCLKELNVGSAQAEVSTSQANQCRDLDDDANFLDSL